MPRRFRKDDVETYYDMGARHPAINVKCHRIEPTRGEWITAASDNGADLWEAIAFLQWVEEKEEESEESYNNLLWSLFGFASEGEREFFDNCVTDPDYGRSTLLPHGWNANAKIYQAGRSGGWLLFDGLPDVETWDAIAVSAWGRIVAFARSLVDGIPYQVASLLFINEWESAKTDAINAWHEEQREQLRQEISGIY